MQQTRKDQPDKNEHACPVTGKCGGCIYSGVPYSTQLGKKEKRVRALLGTLCEVRPIVGAKYPCFYRNKVHWAYGYDGKRTYAGRYAENSHRIIENDNCLLEDRECTMIQMTIRKLAASFKIPTYDERSRRGLLRRVLIRKGVATGEVMVILVLAEPVLPGKKAFIKKLVELHPSVKTVLINTNTRTDSMILGAKTVNEYGRGFIWDELLGVRFKISPESFYQINHDQTEKLYSLAIEAAGLQGGEKILDAYCGIGTIGLCAASSAKDISLTGVEQNRAAVIDARENAKVNSENKEGKDGLVSGKKVRFYADDATEFIMEASAKKEKYDVVFLDPPRSGTTEAFISACGKLSPRRIVYVSCDPTTLARDLKIFKQHGYIPSYAVPVDMFPFTEHTEVVSLLQRMSNIRERTIKTRTVEMQEKGLIRRENGKRNGRWEVIANI